MNAIVLVSGFGWGVLFGGIYFGGLWITVRSVCTVRNPNKYLLTSFLVRIFLLMGGVWVVFESHPLILLPLMAGFLAIRFMMIKIAQHGCARRRNAPQP